MLWFLSVQTSEIITSITTLNMQSTMIERKINSVNKFIRKGTKQVRDRHDIDLEEHVICLQFAHIFFEITKAPRPYFCGFSFCKIKNMCKMLSIAVS